MIKHLFFVTSFIIGLGSLDAQELDNYDISYSSISEQLDNIIFRKASNGIEYKPYDEAKINYSTLLKTNPEDVKANYGMAITLYANRECAKSIPYFEKALKKSIDTVAEMYFLLANAYHLAANYNKAEDTYKITSGLLNSNHFSLSKQEQENVKNYILHRITMCENGKRLSTSSQPGPLFKSKQKIVVSNISGNINSKYDDFGAVFSANDSTVYFTSRRDDEGNVYYSHLQNNQWSNAASIGWPINTLDYEAIVNISPDQKRLSFFKNSVYGSALHYSDYADNKWNLPQLSINKGERYSTFKETVVYSYAVTASKDELFVVSDKKGGLGGKDIYISKKVNDTTWGSIENIGIPVNTPYDETALSISPNGDTLYFSSNGDQSIGGYDVFVSYKKEGKWSQPENMGNNINTPGDDLFFSFLHNSKKACYSSSAFPGDSTNNLDIYLIDIY